ncbi:MAG: NAD-dependent epimerase/dehydratase family protein [Candidatus Omnitrophota bacterium]
MKNVLITGANGFLGTALLHSLNHSDWNAIPLVQEKTGCPHEIVVDFCDDGFSDILRTLPRVDAVVHLGARIGWDGSSRAELFRPNVLATALLVEWARRNDSHFVFASAALIAGEWTSGIHAECDLNSTNDYLYSKWLGEQIIQMAGVRHTILRFAGIFGKNGPAHLGINNAISGALEGKLPVLKGNGNIKRNYIYVHDAGAVIRYCMDHPHTVDGIHLAGGSHMDTMGEMLDTICRILLPGHSPEIAPGLPGVDQLVESSTVLPKGRPFEDAIKEIAKQ